MGILILGSNGFLTELFRRFPDAEAGIRAFLRRPRPA